MPGRGGLPARGTHDRKRQAQRHADREATLCMGARLRYRDIDALSLALAGWLQQQGLVKGDRVAVMMPKTKPPKITTGTTKGTAALAEA